MFETTKQTINHYSPEHHSLHPECHQVLRALWGTTPQRMVYSL